MSWPNMLIRARRLTCVSPGHDQQQIAEWLCKSWSTADQSTFRREHLEGTGQWLFENPEFHGWKTGPEVFSG